MTPRWLVPDWSAAASVHALSTWRDGGDSVGRYASLNLGDHVGDAPAAVAANRRALRERARLPGEPVWLRQVHGVQVADLDVDLDRGGDADAAAGVIVPPREADAAVTRRPGRVCAILTADCLPVLFAADRGEAVGAAHAGWRGLAAGVLEATVRALGVPPERLQAWIGPGISARHYEVGAEVREALLHADPQAADQFQPSRPGRFLADLPALARRRLERLGLRRVALCAECTYADANRYFSHRREGPCGRQASLIWLG